MVFWVISVLAIAGARVIFRKIYQLANRIDLLESQIADLERSEPFDEEERLFRAERELDEYMERRPFTQEKKL